MRKNEAVWVESRQRWQIKVQLDGTRRTFADPTPGKKGKIAAERKADCWLADNTIGENTKCGVLLDRYFDHVQATTSKSNWRPIGMHIEVHIRPVLGDKKICRVTENTLQTVIDEAYAKGLSARMLRNIKSTLMAWMKFCRKEHVTTLHPEDITIPNGAKKSTRSVADPKDIRTLFSSDKTTWRGEVCSDRYIHAYRLAVLIGLRPGELLGLRWSDVKKDKLTIRRSLNDFMEFTPGKNENARRDIMISGLVADEIEQQRELLHKEGIISAYVFPRPNAEPTSQDTYRSYWKRYREHNKIKKLTPYEMRHTFVSVNKEMPEGLKKMVVGHSADMDTEGVYGHEMEGDRKAAAAYSDAAFRKILGK